MLQRAINDVLADIRAGTNVNLAIYRQAKRYGLTTTEISRGMNERRYKKQDGRK